MNENKLPIDNSFGKARNLLPPGRQVLQQKQRLLFKMGVAVTMLVVCGCEQSPYTFAPISGVVTFDGEPLPEARVSFYPKAVGKELNAGPSSSAVTDREGRFELVALSGEEGAVVGKHKVRITTYRDRIVEGTEKIEILVEEKLPLRYNYKSELTKEVSTAGDTSCNFDLTSS